MLPWDVVSSIQTLVNGLNTPIQNISRDVRDSVTNTVNGIKAKVDQISSDIRASASAAVSNAERSINNSIATVKQSLSQITSDVSRNVTTAVGGIQSFLQGQVTGLSSAVGGVRDLVYSQASTVVSQVSNAIAQKYNEVRDTLTRSIEGNISNVRAWIDSASANAQNVIGNKVDTILNRVIDNGKSIVEQVVNSVNKVTTAIDRVKDDVSKQIGDTIGGIVPTLTTMLGQGITQITAALQDLGVKIMDVEQTSQIVGSVIGKHAPEIADWLGNLGASTLGVGILGTMEALERETPEGLDQLLQSVKSDRSMPPFIASIIDELLGKVHPIGAVILPILAAAVLIPVLNAALAPVYDAATQTARQVLPNTLIDTNTMATANIRGYVADDWLQSELAKQGYDTARQEVIRRMHDALINPADLISLYRRGSLTLEALREQMARHGFSAAQTDDMVTASLNILAADDNRAAYLRGIITPQRHDANLAAVGYPLESIEAIKSLYNILPGAQDLIRMAVREVFSPSQRQTLGLDADFPQDFATWGKQIGLDDTWAKNFWAAHWELPSPSQGYEMLHRELITDTELGALLKALDYSPTWRDKLQAISYSPLTRVDIRRMHKLGQLTNAEVLSAYKAIGYDATNAQRLLDFTIALNTEEHNLEIEPFRGSLRGRIVSAYINNTITAENTKNALQGLGYTMEQTLAFVGEADFTRATHEAELIRAGVGKLYTGGGIDWNEAQARLAPLGFGDGELASLKKVWDLNIEYREMSATEHEARDLTKAEVLAAYKDRILPPDEVKSMLSSMGYDEHEVNVLIALADTQAMRAEQTALKDTIKAKYLKGLVSMSDASIQLDALGMRPEHRDALLARWETEKITKAAVVPLGMINDAYVGQFINEARARELLNGHGLPDDIINATLTLWTGDIKTGIAPLN